MSDYGTIYVSSAANSTIGTPDTFQKMSGTTTAGTVNNMSQKDNAELRYDGVVTKDFLCSMSVRLTSAAEGEPRIGIGKNGSVVAASEISFGAEGYGVASVDWIISLATSDYLSIMVTSDSGEELSTSDGILTAVAL